MTRYDDVIARAVAALPLDPAERQATYNRARSAQTERLRAVEPRLPEAAIEAEQAALEEAIRRVEVQFGGSADQNLDPPPDRRLDRRWSGLRIAALCDIGIVVVAI